ncbi:MAG: alpha/beta hydrolase [Candidatus Binatia bacterium]
MPRIVWFALFALFATAPAEAFDRAVTFTVQNVNRSLVPCPTGGGTIEIRGHLTAPDPLPSALTVYLHGLGFDEVFWRFREVPGLDFTSELAARGHASLTIDRLGYGESTTPASGTTGSCLGAQADIAHQIVEQLRSGDYTIEEGEAPSFDRIALAGHSVGGSIAQIEAYSFGDIDGLLVMEWADLGFSADITVAFVQAGVDCVLNPNGYSYMGRTDADFDHLFFNTKRPLLPTLPLLDKPPTADPAVIAAANDIRSQDPCGDKLSIPAAIAVSTVGVALIHVPTLLLCGGDDAIFPAPACGVQRLRFLSAKDLTATTIPRTGHAPTIGFTAGAVRDAVALWLSARGF